MDVGRRIREVRESKGMEQVELAEKINISQSKMNKIETGYQKRIEPEILNDLANVLGVTTDYLLCRTTNPKPIEHEDNPISIAFSHGGEELSEDEKEHLEAELKKYRELKARFMKEKNRE